MKRRFVGPSIVSLLLCFLFIDYLSYSRAGRSSLGGIWRVLELLATEVYNAVSSLSILSDTVFLLLSGISVTGILLIWLSLREAKKAMNGVTESTAGSAFESAQLLSRDPDPLPETAPLSAPLLLRPSTSTIGLTAKMIGGFAFTATIFCLVSLIIVYVALRPAVEKEVINRSSLLASGLGEAAANYIAEKDFSALHKEVARYASRRDVAYIAIRDNRGQLIAQSPADAGIIARASFSKESMRGSPWATVRYGERYVNETLVELDRGRKGLLYIGIWGEVLEQELRLVLWPLGWAIVVMLIATVTAFGLCFRHTRGRLRSLARSAEQISKGNFEIAVSVGRKDEIDEIACSLERMRSSLKAVMVRLEEVSTS